MDKFKLAEAVSLCKENTRDALRTVYDTLNQGQQKKLLQNESVKRLFDLYEVNYGG